ncbi:hypothetical protein SISSUDRAFT_1069086 [Sistotremastrum suecicum HHB10207 ss-3]|uniref:Mediator of RNA polymerase II transcription subunit 18 n=1 Tax=Sistotremastrum suecicum HHB10207 ss-3 TaxID=1314776 RepID=A0A166HMY9_9AGAM|nr:hypothetical protein SISSUDRAFT_1069086 [Sistotremastrum suecicum HHB10207 ss-3]
MIVPCHSDPFHLFFRGSAEVWFEFDQQTNSVESGRALHTLVALFGEFFPKDFNQLLNRFTFLSESARKTHVREVVFEPLEHSSRDLSLPEPVLLRCKKELLDNSSWQLYSFLKPEPVRVHPEATVRAAVYCQMEGDALGFASALGYKQKHQIYKRGYLFKRANLDIQMFQEERVDPKTHQPIRADPEALWEVEVKSSSPTRNTPETPLSNVIDAILEVQVAMRGLLDLRRKDA